MKSTFHNADVLLTLFTVLALAIFLAGCNYTHSQSYESGSSSTDLSVSNETEFKQSSPLSSKRFRESSEFKWTSPPSSTGYNGTQNAQELMKVFDDDYNSGHLKTEVSAFRKVAGIKIESYRSKLTMLEIDARYPRAEWLQMLLDRGITINNFNDYTKYLLKRHTFALLKDNPKLRQFEIFDLPPTSDWETHKEAYINKLVTDHAKNIWNPMKEIEHSKKEVERAKAQIEHSKQQLERALKEVHSQQLEHVKEEVERAIERSKEEVERAKAQIEHSKRQLEHTHKEVNSQHFEYVKKEVEHAIERSQKEIERAIDQIESAQKTLERTKKSASPPNGSDR